LEKKVLETIKTVNYIEKQLEKNGGKIMILMEATYQRIKATHRFLDELRILLTNKMLAPEKVVNMSQEKIDEIKNLPIIDCDVSDEEITIRKDYTLFDDENNKLSMSLEQFHVGISHLNWVMDECETFKKKKGI
tara:strand:+ start:320 stop:721 length:402 start_codon:yes stop_codon:yes gene_type:complete